MSEINTPADERYLVSVEYRSAAELAPLRMALVAHTAAVARLNRGLVQASAAVGRARVGQPAATRMGITDGLGIGQFAAAVNAATTSLRVGRRNMQAAGPQLGLARPRLLHPPRTQSRPTVVLTATPDRHRGPIRTGDRLPPLRQTFTGQELTGGQVRQLKHRRATVLRRGTWSPPGGQAAAHPPPQGILGRMGRFSSQHKPDHEVRVLKEVYRDLAERVDRGEADFGHTVRGVWRDHLVARKMRVKPPGFVSREDMGIGPVGPDGKLYDPWDPYLGGLYQSSDPSLVQDLIRQGEQAIEDFQKQIMEINTEINLIDFGAP